MTGNRKWLKRGLLVVLGLFIGLILAEGTARLIALPKDSDLLFNSPESSPAGLYVIDSGVRVKPASHFKGTVGALDYRVELRTNALGLRGPELQSVQQQQWVALGDSFTMAVQVDESETFHHIIGKTEGNHYWNAGVDGYSTWQSTLRLLQLQSEIDMEGALLTFFTGNDFHDNARFSTQKNHPLPAAIGEPIPRAKTSSWKRFLLRHSKLYAQYRIYSHRQQIASGTGHFHQGWKDELQLFSKSGKGRLQGLKQETLKALQDFKRSTNGMDVMVAIAPPAFVVDQSRSGPTFSLVGLDPAGADLDAPQKAALDLVRKAGLSACDLTAALRKAEKEAPTYYKFDGHWTPHGHQAVANAILTCKENKQ